MCRFAIKRRVRPIRLVLLVGMCLVAGQTLTVVCQTPIAKPSPASQDALPVYIEEFFLSEAVRSEEHGELQLTLDGMVSRGQGSAADGKSAGIDIEYGMTKRLQFTMETPYGIQSTASSELPVSWSTQTVGLLYQFIRSNHPFALCGSLGANLPLTSRGETSFEPELLAAKGFGKLQIHFSVIPELGGNDRSLDYNIAAVRPFVHQLIPTLEFNGRRNSGINSFYVTPGIYKHLPHRLEVGIGVPIGASSHSNPAGAILKMTWEIGGDDDD